MRQDVSQTSQDELEKEAFLGQIWDRVVDWFRPEARAAKGHVSAHYESTNPGRWDQFVTRAANSPEFIKQLQRSNKASDKDVLHAINMAGLQKGPTLGQVESTSSPGVQYQIKKLPSGDFACTCKDWRYKGSVRPGYQCKHIDAHREGLTKVAMLKEKNASFRERTLEHFNELKKNRDQELRETRSGLKESLSDSASPYSNLLTQDEEPSLYNPRPPQAMEDPEVILGPTG